MVVNGPMTVLRAYWLCCLSMVTGIAMVELGLLPTVGKFLAVISLAVGVVLFFARLIQVATRRE